VELEHGGEDLRVEPGAEARVGRDPVGGRQDPQVVRRGDADAGEVLELERLREAPHRGEDSVRILMLQHCTYCCLLLSYIFSVTLLIAPDGSDLVQNLLHDCRAASDEMFEPISFHDGTKHVTRSYEPNAGTSQMGTVVLLC